MSAKAPTAPDFESAGTDATPEEQSAPVQPTAVIEPLPAAQPAAAPAQPAAAAEPTYERDDLDRYVVLLDGPIGYVEWVSPVFVCYSGNPYRNSSEIAQVHDFHDALHAVATHHARTLRQKRAL